MGSRLCYFTDFTSFPIRGWFWAPSTHYLLIRHHNGRHFEFTEAEGYTWRCIGRNIHIAGWTVQHVLEFAAVGGMPAPIRQLEEYVFGPETFDSITVPIPNPIVIPDIPLDEFSNDILLPEFEENLTADDENMFCNIGGDVESSSTVVARTTDFGAGICDSHQWLDSMSMDGMMPDE